MMNETPIQKMKRLLADERIKDNCDYAVVHKYNQTRVMCFAEWKDIIAKAAVMCGVVIHEWFTYDYD